MDRLDALTEEYGVVFWQSDPENLFISIRDMATFQEQLDSNPLLRQMLDRIARNPYPGSTGIDTDPERSSSDPMSITSGRSRWRLSSTILLCW
jgi:hypothetical protein